MCSRSRFGLALLCGCGYRVIIIAASAATVGSSDCSREAKPVLRGRRF